MTGPLPERASPAPGITAVVARIPGDGGHGVLVLDVRDIDMVRSVLLPADQWRALIPRILAQCDLADRPGQLPTSPPATGDQTT